MHGGTSKGPKTKLGKERCRLAAFQNGKYTKEAQTLHKHVMALIRQSKNFLKAFGPS